MPKQSAGLLLYHATTKGEYKVFLVHPGGPFWAKKDAGAWSLPKGEYTTEDPLKAAMREFQEEVGTAAPQGESHNLGEVKYSNKIVRAWAVEAKLSVAQVRSNTFTLEWPPNSGQLKEYPEIDRAEWWSLGVARKKLVKGQVAFIDRLEAYLNHTASQLSLL